MPEESIVFERAVETVLSQNNLIGTIPTLYKDYEITLEVNPTTPSNGKNIIQLSSTGDDCCNLGDRIPGIWFHYDNEHLPYDNSKLVISIYNSISGDGNRVVYEGVPKDRTLNQWTKIKIKQSIQSDSTYLYELSINGRGYHYETNTSPEEFSNVLIYAANPFYDAAPASIRNLKIKSASKGEKFRLESNKTWLYKNLMWSKIIFSSFQ